MYARSKRALEWLFDRCQESDGGSGMACRRVVVTAFIASALIVIVVGRQAVVWWAGRWRVWLIHGDRGRVWRRPGMSIRAQSINTDDC